MDLTTLVSAGLDSSLALDHLDAEQIRLQNKNFHLGLLYNDLIDITTKTLIAICRRIPEHAQYVQSHPKGETLEFRDPMIKCEIGSASYWLLACR